MVQAAAILLYVGSVLAVLSGLWRLFSGEVVETVSGGGAVLVGLLCLGLGRALQLRKRWAQRTVLVLCGVGVVLAVVRGILTTPVSGVSDVTWPVVYAILLSTRTAREWFAGAS